MSKKVLAVTGFLFPETELFELSRKETSELDELTLRDDNYSKRSLINYFITNKVSLSPMANSLYGTYHGDPSYSNFVALVDFMSDVLSKVDCYDFMEWQAYNRHTTAMTIMFCRDLVKGDFKEFIKYSNLNAQTRFLMNESITKDVGAKRHALIVGYTPVGSFSWVNLLAPLMSDRGNFVTAFRYLFVSNY